MTTNQNAKAGMDREEKVFIAVGTAAGLVLGMVASFVFSLSIWWSLVAGAFIGGFGGAGMYSFMYSEFIQSDEPRHKRNRIASATGSVVGLLAGIYISRKLEVAWYWWFVSAIAIAGLFGVAFNAVQLAYYNSRADKDQLAIPVTVSFVGDKKLNAVRTLFKARANLGEVEHVVRVVTEWHFMKLQSLWTFPYLVIALLLWGAADFTGYHRLIDVLKSGYEPWLILLALACFGLWWYWKKGGLSVRKTTRVAIVGFIFLWGGIGFPGAPFLRDLFESGKPQPWFAGIGVCLVWMAWRWLNLHYSYMFVSDIRVVVGVKFPFPFPSRSYNVPLNKVQTNDPKDTTLGNVLGYGHLSIDTAGQRDVFWEFLRYVKGHRVVNDSLVIK